MVDGTAAAVEKLKEDNKREEEEMVEEQEREGREIGNFIDGTKEEKTKRTSKRQRMKLKKRQNMKLVRKAYNSTENKLESVHKDEIDTKEGEAAAENHEVPEKEESVTKATGEVEAKQLGSCEGVECTKEGALVCAGCRVTVYCGEGCSTSTWPDHREECRRRRSRRRERRRRARGAAEVD